MPTYNLQITSHLRITPLDEGFQLFFLCWIVVKTGQFPDCSQTVFSRWKCSCLAAEKSWKLQWKPWAAECCTVTKRLLADCVCLLLFCLIEELLCRGQEALSGVTPAWPFFLAYWPLCSQRAPISALERPLVHSAVVEDVVPLLSNDTSYCAAAGCLSWMCLCAGVTKRAFCLAVTAERSCVSQVNVLSVTFVLLSACITDCSVHAERRLALLLLLIFCVQGFYGCCESLETRLNVVL